MDLAAVLERRSNRSFPLRSIRPVNPRNYLDPNDVWPRIAMAQAIGWRLDSCQGHRIMIALVLRLVEY